MRQQKIPDRLCKTSIGKYVKYFHETAEQNKILLADKIREVARHICDNEKEPSNHVIKMKELLIEWDIANKCQG